MALHKYFKKQRKEQEEHLDELDSSKEVSIPLPSVVSLLSKKELDQVNETVARKTVMCKLLVDRVDQKEVSTTTTLQKREQRVASKLPRMVLRKLVGISPEH